MRNSNFVTLSTIVVFVFLLSSCANQNKVSKSNSQSQKIIIDVRTEQEFESGHLENAINIPHTQIKEKIRDYVTDLNQPIMLYCRSGKRAGIALQVLKELGYVNVENAGGYNDLIKK